MIPDFCHELVAAFWPPPGHQIGEALAESSDYLVEVEDVPAAFNPA
jgi:hypothetical protein